MSAIGSSYMNLQSLGTMVIGVIITIVGVTGAYLAKETKNKLIWGCVGLIGVVGIWGGVQMKQYTEANPAGAGKVGLVLLSMFVLERIVRMVKPTPVDNLNPPAETNPKSPTSLQDENGGEEGEEESREGDATPSNGE